MLKIKHTSDLLKTLDNFNIDAKQYAISPIENGFINDTYLVSYQNTSLYILQRINHDVFKDVEGVMSNIKMAFLYLKSESYSPIKLVTTKTDKSYFTNELGHWRLMTFIPNSTNYNTTKNTSFAFEVGRIIGLYHRLIQKVENVDAFKTTIPNFHDVASREQQFNDALAQAESQKIENAAKTIAYAKNMLLTIKSYNLTNLPVRICHNDTKLNNILFSKTDVKALCLIDLDTIMKGYFYNDFGDAVRTIVNSAEESEKDHSKITFNTNMFDAFIDGLQKSEIQLSKNEIETMAFGAIIMPFLHGIRALTDFLNNNKYYKVQYANQNLDRAESLFNFSEKAFNRLEYMQKIITLKFKTNGTE